MPSMTEAMKFFTRLGDYPGLTLRASINSIICVGWKVFGEKTIHCINAWDYPPRWKKDVNDDYDVVKSAYNILKGADAVVTHNGKRFDWKFFQTRLLFHGFPPLPRIAHIDTCLESKRNLLMFNNKLDTLAQFLTKERKLENGGWDLWVKVSQRDKKAQKLMTEYCKQDVNVLEKVFKKLRPFVRNLPNYNLYNESDKPLCPSCGGTKLRKMGTLPTKTRILQRYLCWGCGSRCSMGLRSKRPET